MFLKFKISRNSSLNSNRGRFGMGLGWQSTPKLNMFSGWKFSHGEIISEKRFENAKHKIGFVSSICGSFIIVERSIDYSKDYYVDVDKFKKNLNSDTISYFIENYLPDLIKKNRNNAIDRLN